MKEHKPISQVPVEKDPTNLRENENFQLEGENKPESAGAVERNVLRLATATKPLKATSMHTDMPTRTHSRKSKGRLNRETMVKLGKVLGDYFDHVRQQKMPDRIAEVLSELDKVNDKGTS